MILFVYVFAYWSIESVRNKSSFVDNTRCRLACRISETVCKCFHNSVAGIPHQPVVRYCQEGTLLWQRASSAVDPCNHSNMTCTVASVLSVRRWLIKEAIDSLEGPECSYIRPGDGLAHGLVAYNLVLNAQRDRLQWIGKQAR